MSEGPSESRMMEAAEEAIRALQREVKEAKRAAAWRARLVWVLTGVTILGIITTIVLAVSVYNQNQLTNAVRQGAISSCNSGNDARATNQKIWDEFLNILINNPNNARIRAMLLADVKKLGLSVADQQALEDIINANWTNDPSNLVIAKAFELYIAAHEKQQACTAIYSR